MKGSDPNDLHAEVPTGVPCITCGYALDGLPAHPNTLCPECGTPIERSLRDRPLALADLCSLLQRQIARRLALAAAFVFPTSITSTVLIFAPTLLELRVISLLLFLAWFILAVQATSKTMMYFPQLRKQADLLRYGFVLVPICGSIYVASLAAMIHFGLLSSSNKVSALLLMLLISIAGVILFVVYLFALFRLIAALRPLSETFGMPRLGTSLTLAPPVLWVIATVFVAPLVMLAISLVLALLARRAHKAAREAPLAPRAA